MTDDSTKPTKKSLSKPRLSSSGKIYLGLFLGVVCGIFFGEMANWLQIVGDIFIKLLQITVIPYISLSLIIGIGGLNYKEVMAHAIKGGGVYLLISAIALVIVMLIPLSFPDWLSSSFFSTHQVKESPTIDFLRLFIPSNPFHAYAFALVPAVVVFSILVGIALIGIPDNTALLEPLKVFHAAMMKITGIVAKLAPIGVFALIASAAGTLAIEDLTRLQVYIIVYALISLVLSLIILPGIITVFTPFSFKHIIKALRTPMITAFATGSSLIILPMLIEHCKQLIADYSLKAVVDQDEADASLKVLIPSYYPFPTASGLLSIAFVLFAGWYIGSDVSVADYPLLMLVGVPSLFGGTLLTIPSLLDLLRLPIDLFQVFISIDVIIARFGTIVSAMHYATIGLIGTMALVGHIRLRWLRLVRVTLIGTALILPILFGVRIFYSTVVVAPYTMADMLKSLRFLGTPQPAKVYAEVPEELILAGAKPASLEQIEKRGLLRVCYQPNEYPSAFVNNADPPQLVGFDVEMAHRFAEMLQLPLEFLPAEMEDVAITLLNRGVCDIYMRTLPVHPRRSQEFGLTSPVYRSSLGLIVRDYRRNEFYSWEDINKHGDSLRLGVEDTPGYIERLSIFTSATIVPIQDMEQRLRLLESGAEDIDAIADMAEEGAALTILYPNFSHVVPRPTVFLPVSYAVARGNSDLLLALNSWLLMKKEEGVIDALYKHWMLGEAAEVEKLPRWSVIRNVLGWVE
jgi:Na+/H+-dicarboxylate symporter/ABC-type amino acid transport substrate-binding protein